ncbi:MAG: GDSL-type esterase/lipase family protein [Pseudomonadota bacterium]
MLITRTCNILVSITLCFTLALASASTHANTVWTIGDSRVDGFRPDYESYRFDLWKNFIVNNLDIDLVGSNTDEANYPTFNGRQFDRNHDGYGGAQTTDFLPVIDELAGSVSSADFVLIGIGGNDLVESNQSTPQVVANIGTLIDRIRLFHPRAIFIVEQIARARSDMMTPSLTSKLQEFNGRIATLAIQKSTPASRVISVNMDAGWSDEFLADTVHYNAAGAKLVADRYFNTLRSIISNEDPINPSPPVEEPDPSIAFIPAVLSLLL